jgi:dephospho-CoA kinase
LFASLGRTIISADLIAADIVDQDDTVREKIRLSFGDMVYAPDGLLDRKKLAAIVFANPSERKKLNAIVHPRVFTTIDSRINSLSQHARAPFVLIEAALIYESGMDRDLDYVIVVDASEEHRVQRVMERDGVTREEVLQRIRAQMPSGRKRTKGDFVLQNDCTEDDLAQSVRFLDRLITLQLGSRNES